MNLTITIRLPGRARTADAATIHLIRTLLPLIEPTAMLLAEAAGMGLLGKIICATAIRSARHALAA